MEEEKKDTPMESQDSAITNEGTEQSAETSSPQAAPPVEAGSSSIPEAQAEVPQAPVESAPEAPVEAAAPTPQVDPPQEMETTAAAPTPEEEALSEGLDPDHQWYVIRTYSGYEQKAKLALNERIKQHGMEKEFSKVLIPSENVIELVRGQKKTTSRKFFPGYMLVRMNLTDDTWHILKNTPMVTGFVGNATKPPAVPEEEVAKITTQMQEGSLKPRPKVSFEEGENVRVVDGPFNNFNGLVEHVNEEKGKLRVLVSIFGRSTPVELDFVQVEKN